MGATNSSLISQGTEGDFQGIQLQSMKIPTGINLLDLPPELKFQIFSYLHHDAQTCLGLTCHKLYPYWEYIQIHDLQYRRMKFLRRKGHLKLYRLQVEFLHRPIWCPPPPIGRFFYMMKNVGHVRKDSELPKLLKDFMGPHVRFEPNITRMWLSKERLRELERLRRTKCTGSFQTRLQYSRAMRERVDTTVPADGFKGTVQRFGRRVVRILQD